KVTPVVRDGQPSDHESYRYDSGNQRVIKTTTQQTSNSTQTQRTLYLPGLELRTTANSGTVKEALHTLIVGEAGRAQVRMLHWERGKPNDISNNQMRYSYDNLVGSSSLEVDGDGNLISLEEYYPYGGTAVWTARSQTEADYKTVRYSGKERDATGLYYYGYRYYQPWAGRWLSADPAGTVDGLNLYNMVRNNPISNLDYQGTETFSIDEFLAMKKDYSGSHHGRNHEKMDLFGSVNAPKNNSSDKRPLYSSEHTILASILTERKGRAGNVKKGQEEQSTVINEMDKLGHAYQEVDEYHKAHIGSNNGKKATEAKTITNDYETFYSTQVNLLKEGLISSVIQTNQIAYFTDNPELTNKIRKDKLTDKATESFIRTVIQKDNYFHMEGDKVIMNTITFDNKIEMILSRIMGVLGRTPSNKEFTTLLKKNNINFSRVRSSIFPLLTTPGYEKKSIFNSDIDVVGKSKNAKRKAIRREQKKNAMSQMPTHH
ncbi:RHS repeat-associated core domain-containing protein, partial [Xenorhabdus bovienii]|uniref:RHS repeat-associated core domain-containing protein n=1 Tax=Xenorhabdus bovienii TaxID=40576 RepID=UPI00301BA729|nr:hypothetical protein [Xenorhabdus bovienii]MDE9589992.1 hypothetical protein [Xenorhabdus bovienii]